MRRFQDSQVSFKRVVSASILMVAILALASPAAATTGHSPDPLIAGQDATFFHDIDEPAYPTRSCADKTSTIETTWTATSSDGSMVITWSISVSFLASDGFTAVLSDTEYLPNITGSWTLVTETESRIWRPNANGAGCNPDDTSTSVESELDVVPDTEVPVASFMVLAVIGAVASIYLAKTFTGHGRRMAEEMEAQELPTPSSYRA